MCFSWLSLIQPQGGPRQPRAKGPMKGCGKGQLGCRGEEGIDTRGVLLTPSTIPPCKADGRVLEP